MMEHNHMPEWMQEIRRGKALAEICEAAKVTDSEGQVVEMVPKAEEPAEAEESSEAGETSTTRRCRRSGVIDGGRRAVQGG